MITSFHLMPVVTFTLTIVLTKTLETRNTNKLFEINIVRDVIH